MFPRYLNSRNDAVTALLTVFKPDKASNLLCLLAERWNAIDWIYKQKPITFNRSASRLLYQFQHAR